MDNGFDKHSQEPAMLPPEQILALPTRIYDILFNLHEGYGLDGHGPREGSVAYGQMMLGELLKDLDIDLSQMGVEVVDEKWKFDDLPKLATYPVMAISAAPNIPYDLKVEILSGYSDMLTNSMFAFTHRGGRKMVRDALNETISMRGSPEARTEQQRLNRDIERRWRHDRNTRIASSLGSLVRRK